MPSPTWTIAIDLNDDGDYTDTNENITTYVKPGSSWQIGFAQPYDTIARAATATLILNNADQRFSPEYTSGTLYPNFTRGKRIKISANYSSTDYDLFVGRISNITPQANTKGPRETTITVQGFLREAQLAEVFVPIMENVTADEALAVVMEASAIYPPALGKVWRLGITGFTELETNTILADSADIFSAEVGINTFTIIGDEWDEGVSLYGALRDIAGREAGRIFVSRDGVITLWNAHHFITKNSSDQTFTQDAFTEMTYGFGSGVINNVIVQARPRTIGTVPETLAELDKAIKIGKGKTKAVSFRYRDTSIDATISGKDVITPVATTDYTANANEDGTGTDYTDAVTIKVIEIHANRARFEFTNGGPVDVWLQPSSKVRGIKITDFGIIDAEAEDETSIGTYQRHKFTYPFIMDDLDVAQQMANYYVSLWKDPAGRVTSVTIPTYRDATLLTQALTRTIGDRITISESQTGLTTVDYFIIGERWDLQGGMVFLTWLLEPADANQYWLLDITGFTELETATILAPF